MENVERTKEEREHKKGTELLSTPMEEAIENMSHKRDYT